MWIEASLIYKPGHSRTKSKLEAWSSLAAWVAIINWGSGSWAGGSGISTIWAAELAILTPAMTLEAALLTGEQHNGWEVRMQVKEGLFLVETAGIKETS